MWNSSWDHSTAHTETQVVPPRHMQGGSAMMTHEGPPSVHPMAAQANTGSETYDMMACALEKGAPFVVKPPARNKAKLNKKEFILNTETQFNFACLECTTFVAFVHSDHRRSVIAKFVFRLLPGNFIEVHC